MKLRMPLGLKAAAIVFAGIMIMVGAVGMYGNIVYQRLLEQKFAEKIVTLGENCVYMSEPYVRLMMERRGEGLTQAERDAMQFVLEAAVTREDMLYAALKVQGRVVAKCSADGRADFKLPKSKKTGKDMLGYFLSGVEGMSGMAYEASFPIEYKGKDTGEVVVGFDKTGMKKEMDRASFSAMAIGLAGCIVMSLIIFGYLYVTMIRPVKGIARVAGEISRGEVGDEIKVTKGGDEIEDMTRSFDSMSGYIQKVASAAEGLSTGSLADTFEARSEKDVLGNSFKRMIGYINEIAIVLSDIAAGNLAVQYARKSDTDELGSVVIAMLEGLKELVTGIKTQSESLADSSKELANISEQSQTTISQLAETVANISQATSEAAKNSQTASSASVSAEASAKQGAEKMDRLMSMMAELKSAVEDSNKRMQVLSQHSEEINSMVAIIESVADETKLLSFNAAIEAARAGEAGRGFVVVAEEIRKLSDMSTSQAKKISSRIKQVRADIATAVELSQKSASEIVEGSELTKEAHSIFGDIVKNVDEAAAQVENIAASSQQIAASSEQASASSQEQSSAMEELSAAASELAETARRLKDMTDRFRI